MNPIFQAIDQGYSPEEILRYITRIAPSLVPKVEKAVSNGYALKEILGFLAQTSMKEDNRGLSESEIHGRNTRIASEMGQKGLMAAGALAATPIAASAVRSAFSRALPQSLTGGLLGPSNSINPDGAGPSQSASVPTLQTNPGQSPQLPSSSQPPVNAGNITQQQQITQPEVKSIDPSALLEKSGLKKHVDELSKRTKDPKKIAALLYNRFPAEMKQFQAEAGKNMEDAIGDYLGENPVSDNLKATEEKTTTEQQPKIEKSSIVASPNGIGEVKELRNGEALIDISGKLHKAKEEELIQSPLPEKDLADLYNDVISGIEKESGQQVSRNVYWAGYDPNTNELAYLPHDGGLYIYDDISPDDAKELTNLLSQRKSTGQNYIGAWTKGSSSPIGAQMYQLIQRLQKERGGKGSEYANKFMKVYDALELAKSAAKKQYEERKKKAKKPGID
jgi:hypothetical protein